jgi:nitrate reductase molybdenum cofactor assembly chaperone NarJ/NarW
MDDKSALLKIIALLLQYPDRELLDDLHELDEAIGSISDATAQQECRGFVAHLRATPIRLLQEGYTATFDFSSETCMNLSYHKVGDGKRRGPALVEFQQAYRSMGYEPAAGELPDYLPMVLEFLSICAQDTRSLIMKEYSGEIENLSGKLQAQGSPYRGVFRVLSGLSRVL